MPRKLTFAEAREIARDIQADAESRRESAAEAEARRTSELMGHCAVAAGSKGEPAIKNHDIDAATEWLVNRPKNVSRQVESLALAFAKHRTAHAEPSNTPVRQPDPQ